MKILLLGSSGQLGGELQQTCPDHQTLIPLDYPQVDFCDPGKVLACLADTAPDCIINAAAYTAVDKAEQEPDRAEKINHRAVNTLARYCRDKQVALVQISTDFVFDGQHFKPYEPWERPCPTSVYGRTKLAGEQAVQSVLKADALIIRTAWLYAAQGKNFVKTMLHLMNHQEQLQVIDEQIGTPTWARGLAQAVWCAIEKNLSGIHHWTDAGVASWYDFAVAIQEEGARLGLVEKKIPIQPVPATRYPTPATRPFYSVLDKHAMWQATGIPPVHWRVQLRSMLEELVP